MHNLVLVSMATRRNFKIAIQKWRCFLTFNYPLPRHYSHVCNTWLSLLFGVAVGVIIFLEVLVALLQQVSW